jgi:hypothetical protein
MALASRCQLIEPPKTINSKRAQLETAKELLAEVFHARPKDVEEMIRQRLGSRVRPPSKGLSLRASCGLRTLPLGE